MRVRIIAFVALLSQLVGFAPPSGDARNRPPVRLDTQFPCGGDPRIAVLCRMLSETDRSAGHRVFLSRFAAGDQLLDLEPSRLHEGGWLALVRSLNVVDDLVDPRSPIEGDNYTILWVGSPSWRLYGLMAVVTTRRLMVTQPHALGRAVWGSTRATLMRIPEGWVVLSDIGLGH